MRDFFNRDCMEGMAEYPDKFFDLAIVDPPYGIDISRQSLGDGGGLYRQQKYKRGNWDKEQPRKDYFIELERVSVNQIIWGGNYFSVTPTPCWLVWDKNNGGSDFADCELAWSSFKSPVRKFRYTWSGFIQRKMGLNKEKKSIPPKSQLPYTAGFYKTTPTTATRF